MRAKRALLAAGLVSVMAAPVRSAPPGAAFLTIPVSPAAYSLGMSNAVSALGAEAIGSNPANVGLMESQYDIFSSYASLMDGSQFSHLAAAYAPREGAFIDGFGLSVTRLATGGLQGADSSGNMTGSSFGASDTAITGSVAGRITSSLRLGLTARAIQSQIAGYQSSTAYSTDYGATYTMRGWNRRPMSFGLSVVNVGSGEKFINQTDPLPLGVDLGVAVPLGALTAVLEVNRLIAAQTTEIGTGLALSMGPVDFRAGFLQTNSPSQNLALQDQGGFAARMLGGLTGGVGLRFGPARVDYSVSETNEFGPSQRVALTLRWGSRTAHSSAQSTDNSWHSSDRSDWLIRGLGGY